ncbi:DNA-directed DNA polymerase [Synchytrium microbalum]|uniref:DNA-directed DNA polymerase n=1 Tax=Synchytrium microbalum TaxID=1806994 RepID=A0A507CGB6_9FUNG|nr:DNA-directed DNA polymerase [Synchytrium microbalum]TPX37004.1 DNA-directed DNA polymerase [Synchytrium microbalum]
MKLNLQTSTTQKQMSLRHQTKPNLERYSRLKRPRISVPEDNPVIVAPSTTDVLVEASPEPISKELSSSSALPAKKRKRLLTVGGLVSSNEASATPTLTRANSRKNRNTIFKIPTIDRLIANSNSNLVDDASTSVVDSPMISRIEAVDQGALVAETPIPSPPPNQVETPVNDHKPNGFMTRSGLKVSPNIASIIQRGPLYVAQSPDFGDVSSIDIQAFDDYMNELEQNHAPLATDNVVAAPQHSFIPASQITQLHMDAPHHQVKSPLVSQAAAILAPVLLPTSPLVLPTLLNNQFARQPSSLIASEEVAYVEETDLLLTRPELGLPESVIETYGEAGVKSLYEWQMEALLIDGILNGKKNLVYSAPTSAGKTMVAELIMVKRVLESKKKAIFILPFVSIVSEKTKYLQKMFASTRLNIVGYYASVGSASFDDVDIAICTIEKANGIMNRLLEEQRLDQIGIVVVDELHMARDYSLGVGDEGRGYLLELQLTKMQYVLRDEIQVVAMSATISNIAVLASWLSADLYISDYRPVPLTEYIKVNDTQEVWDVHLGTKRCLKDIYPYDKLDPDMLVPLVAETVAEGNSVLVFCRTKVACEAAAKLLAKLMPVLLKFGLSEDEANNHKNVMAELQRSPGGLDPVLEATVPQGVAYHHAGLTVEERECIEDAFRAGYIRVLCATSTLASGVNLPARRVIFRSPEQHQGGILDPQSYSQMKGRAGRKGYDTVGESIVLCSSKQLTRVKRLLESPLQPVQSCLTSERKGLKRALLEVIAAGVVRTAQDVTAYVERSLLFAEDPSWDRVNGYVNEALEFLLERDLVCKDGECCKATKLGMATVASSLSPEEAIVVFQELRAAMNSFVLAEDLHIVYQVTPTYFAYNDLDWNGVAQVYSRLGDAQSRVATAIGIDQGLVIKVSREGWRKNLGKTADGREKSMILGRFFASLMLADLVREVSFEQIMDKYNFRNRGLLQSLQSSAATFAGMVTVFCERLGWTNLQLLVQQFQDRLNFGVENELLELARIPGIKAFTGRVLFRAGYKTIPSIACASAEEIHKHIASSRPFKINGNYDEAAQNRIEFRIAHQIVQGAQRLLEIDQKEVSRASKKLAHALKTAKNGTKRKRGKKGKPAFTVNNYHRLELPNRSETPVPYGDTRPPGASSPALFDDDSEFDEQLEQEDEATPSLEDAQLEVVAYPTIVHLGENLDAMKNFLQEWPRQPKYAIRVCARREAQNVILEGLAVCWDPSLVFYLPNDTNSSQESKVAWGDVARVLSEPSQKYAFHVQHDLTALAWQRIPVAQPILDPRVAAWALDPEGRDYTLHQALNVIFPSKRFNMASSKIEKCCFEATHVLLLGEHHWSKLEVEGLLRHVVDVEMPVMSILAELELVGLAFEVEYFTGCLNEYRTAIHQIETEAFKLAGRRFSLSSPAQVAQVLYDDLKLPTDNSTNKNNKVTGGRAVFSRSTSKEVLERISRLHPLPRLVVEYRRISTLVFNQLYSLNDAGVMHPYFRHHRVLCEYDSHTATGRVTTKNPNLQNIPHPRSLVDIGFGQGNLVNIRNAFRASPGHILVSSDYSQLELRIIAHMSADRKLLELLNGGGDLFIKLAAQWNGIEPSEVTPEIRKRAKAVAYGVIYGLGPTTLANDMKTSVEEAESLIHNFRNSYEGIPQLIQRITNDCANTGYAETLLGRRRYLPAIFSGEMSKRAQAQRQAVNTTIQGSAADLVKVAMIKIRDVFTSKYGCWYAHEEPDSQALHVPHMVLQIHDELLFEVPITMLDEVKEVVEECMMNAITLSVKMPVRFKKGVRWGELLED